MFWGVCRKRNIMTTNRKSGGFVFDFYQIHAGNPASRAATGNLYRSGITSVCKVEPARMALNISAEGSESPPSTLNAYKEDKI